MELAVVIIPFGLAAIVLFLGKRVPHNYLNWLLAGVMLALFGWLLTLLPTIRAQGPITVGYVWVRALDLAFALYIDGLALLFALLITGIGAAVFLYAGYYLDGDERAPAFFALLLAFAGSMLGVVLAGDLLLLFVCWELTSIFSFALIGFDRDRPAARRAALLALVVTGGGGLSLLVGLSMLGLAGGSFSFAQLLGTGLQTHPWYAGITLLTVLGCLTKSAQVPFHFWQPDFHTTAPTPVSGLLSSVVVKVGIYAIIRNNTMYMVQEAGFVQNILIVLGLIGVFFGGISALRTWNVKRMLAYSTLSQIGFILVAIGWGSPVALLAAIVYIVNHAYIKSGLLMLTGALASHFEGHSADLRDLAGAGRGMVGLSLLYLTGGLALAGVPPLNGFISKLALARGGIDVQGWVVLGLVIGGGLLTLIYTMRTWQLIFQQPPRTDPRPALHGADSALAPALLIGLCIMLGIYATPLVDLAEATVQQISTPQVYTCAVLPSTMLDATELERCTDLHNTTGTARSLSSGAPAVAGDTQ